MRILVGQPAWVSIYADSYALSPEPIEQSLRVRNEQLVPVVCFPAVRVPVDV